MAASRLGAARRDGLYVVASSYETGPGRFGGFITVEDAKSHRVVVGSTLDTTLCMFVAGMATEEGICSDTPQTDWPVPPNSLCDGSGCALGGCDASTCNAWQHDERASSVAGAEGQWDGDTSATP